MITIDITKVIPGDIIRFKSYALRVEYAALNGAGNAITLKGRVSTGGCELVRKEFLAGRTVQVERVTA